MLNEDFHKSFTADGEGKGGHTVVIWEEAALQGHRAGIVSPTGRHRGTKGIKNATAQMVMNYACVRITQDSSRSHLVLQLHGDREDRPSQDQELQLQWGSEVNKILLVCGIPYSALFIWAFRLNSLLCSALQWLHCTLYSLKYSHMYTNLVLIARIWTWSDFPVLSSQPLED